MGREQLRELSSQEEMVAFGKATAEKLAPNTLLALSGDLGAGKTTFAQGLAQGLQIQEPICSPTFIYLNAYKAATPLFHFDLYRLKSPSDFLALGFDEYFDKGGICVIEWPERIIDLLPPTTFWLFFSFNEKGRSVAFNEELLELRNI